MVSQIVKQSTHADTLLDVELDEDFFLSMNTVDAHDERDTIYGNFTGRGKEMLYVLKLDADSMTKYIGCKVLGQFFRQDFE